MTKIQHQILCMFGVPGPWADCVRVCFGPGAERHGTARNQIVVLWQGFIISFYHTIQFG